MASAKLTVNENLPLLDSSVLDELAAALGPSIVPKLTETFLAERERLTLAIIKAANPEDTKETKRLAHALKGASREVGCLRLADLAEQLEQTAESMDAVNLITAAAQIANVSEETGFLLFDYAPSA